METAWPNGARTTIVFRPWRPAISAMRLPKKPQAATITVSPGSASDAMPASMPDVPLAESAIVRPSLRR